MRRKGAANARTPANAAASGIHLLPVPVRPNQPCPGGGPSMPPAPDTMSSLASRLQHSFVRSYSAGGPDALQE